MKKYEDMNEEEKKEYESHFCPMCGSPMMKMGGCVHCTQCDYEKCDI